MKLSNSSARKIFEKFGVTTKALLVFVFGNAFWDKLVDFFGSTDEIICMTIEILAVALIVKFFKYFIVGLFTVSIVLFILFI